MVLVIGFLTITNIALGYGLAVYVNKHYGTLMFRRASAASEVQEPSQAAPVVTQVVAESTALPPSDVSAILEQAVAEPREVVTESQTGVDGEIASSEPIDEENVLAGIQEFRSQLAKMNAPGEEPAVQEELAVAAN